MEKLKAKLSQMIDDTMVHDYNYRDKDIEDCSDYISKDYKEAMIGFLSYMSEMYVNVQALDENQKENFLNMYLEERYK